MIENKKTDKFHNLEMVRVILKSEKNIYSKAKVDSPKAAIKILGNEIRNFANEAFTLINLNTTGEIINFSIVSTGTVNQTIVHPREVFNRAILSNANSVILMHNHPSGNIEPSSIDIETTKRLVFSGKLLGVDVLDHVIVGAGNDNYYSFRENNIMPTININQNSVEALLSKLSQESELKTTKDIIEKLMGNNYENFIKAIVNIETGKNADEVNKIYDRFIKSDSPLLDESLLHDSGFKYDTHAIKENVKITDIAKDMGFTVTKAGRYYTLKEHDSVRIDDHKNQFYRNSTGDHGSVIDFVMHFSNMSFKDAVAYISKDDKYMHTYHASKTEYNVKETKELELPTPDSTNKNAYAYLTKTRGIDPSIVNEFIKKGMLYQDKNKNCVFVSRDDKGELKFINKRGTNIDKRFVQDAKGCDYRHSFFIDNQADKLVMTESIIDAMSYMNLEKINGLNYKDKNYICLSGVTKFEDGLNYHLNKKDYTEVITAFDNDNAGITASENVREYLNKNYQDKNIKITLKSPQEGKDYNDYLNIAKEKAKNNVKENILKAKENKTMKKVDYNKGKMVLEGRLITEPEFKRINTKDGGTINVCNATISSFDPSGEKVTGKDGKDYKRGNIYKMVAYSDEANSLVNNYSKGDTLTCICKPHTKEFEKDGQKSSYIQYNISKIDHGHQIATQLGNLLADYEQGNISQLYENADFGEIKDLETIEFNNDKNEPVKETEKIEEIER